MISWFVWLSRRRSSDLFCRGRAGFGCRAISLIPTVKCPDERAFSSAEA